MKLNIGSLSKKTSSEDDVYKRLEKHTDRTWIPLNLEDGLHVVELENCESAHIQTWLSTVAPHLANQKYETRKEQKQVIEHVVKLHMKLELAFEGQYGLGKGEEN